jgi:hypothetical protein
MPARLAHGIRQVMGLRMGPIITTRRNPSPFQYGWSPFARIGHKTSGSDAGDGGGFIIV